MPIDGDGLKRKRGRPKKIPQANPKKLLKDLEKRLTKKQKEEEKKTLKDLQAKIKPKNKVETIPLSYKPSTEPTIKVDLKTPEPKTPRPRPPIPKSKSRTPTPSPSIPVKNPTPRPRKSTPSSPIAPQNLPTHTPVKTPVGKPKKVGIEMLAGSKQLKRLERIAEDQARDEEKAKLLEEVKKGKKLTKGKPRSKEEKKKAQSKEREEMFKEDKGSQAEDEAMKKAMEKEPVYNPKLVKKYNSQPKEVKEETEQKEYKPTILEIDKKWGLNPANKEAIASRPYYSGKGPHSKEYREWLLANPTSPGSIHWFKTTKEGKEAMKKLELELPESKPVGRPKKIAPEATTNAVVEYNKRHAQPIAEAKSSTTAPVTRTTELLASEKKVSTPTSPAVKKFEEEQNKDPDPPSRIDPVVEDDRATRVKALAEQYYANTDLKMEEAIELAEADIPQSEEARIRRQNAPLYSIKSLPQLKIKEKTPEKKKEIEQQRKVFRESYKPMTEKEAKRAFKSSDVYKQKMEEEAKAKAEYEKEKEVELQQYWKDNPEGPEGFGLNFDKVKWGSLTEQMKHHPEMKSLEQFSKHILSNPKDFQKRTVKRANFYKNVIQGKGLEVDSDSSSSESDEEIISHHNIMPMSRPNCLHPALESSTMTMNPGAYNNIKPLMGALMGEGVSSHIRRTEHMGRTMSHYGDHALHPQMMPMGHYTKHIMKGMGVEPTPKDLINLGVHHLSGKYGIKPEHAEELLHSAMDGEIHPELHSLAKEGLEMGHKHLTKTMGGNLKAGIDYAGKTFAEKTVPHLFHQAGADSVFSVINDPHLFGGAVSESLKSNAGHNAELLMDAGTQKAIDRMNLDQPSATGLMGRGKVSKSLKTNAGANANLLMDAGTQKLIQKIKGGAVSESLKSNAGHNAELLMDAGTQKAIDRMNLDQPSATGLYAQGGEIGDGLYAQGRGLKGSPEMKERMAKLRAMRKKKVKGGALPPPSRSPVTDPNISGNGLYA